MRRLEIDVDGLPPTLSVEEASQIAGLGRSAGYAAVKNGQIPAVRFGRKWRVPTAALLRLLGLLETSVSPSVDEDQATPVGPALSEAGR